MIARVRETQRSPVKRARASDNGLMASIICPTCGSEMEVIGGTTRVCPVCATLQWEENGRIQTRQPERVDPSDLPPELRIDPARR